MSDGWLSERLRTAITAHYDLPIPDGDLLIEAGSLTYRTRSSITDFAPETFTKLVEQHSEVAAALEERHR